MIEQWERALTVGEAHEPNGVFVCGDMNLDSYNNAWLSLDYNLYRLSQLVQRSAT